MTNQENCGVLTKHIPRPPGCGCGDADLTREGQVLRVSTCPVCMYVLLDVMRGREYAIAQVRDGDGTKRVLLKQKEFFSA